MYKIIERKEYLQQLSALRDKRIIKVIIGMRRSGKSTLLKMFAEHLASFGVCGEQIQVYNFEDLDTFAIGDIFQVHSHIKNKLIPDKMNYIFLDEVQNLKDFQRLVDGLFIKENVDLYITGSNANLLSGELATLLTGRYIEIEVLPYSFKEYMDFLCVNPQNLTKNESFTDTKSPLRHDRVDGFNDFIYYGGIPEADNLLLDGRQQSVFFIESILNTIIEKDIFVRNKIANKGTFHKITDLILDSVASFVSPNSIANTLKSGGTKINNETVFNYLNYLEDAMLIFPVKRYDIKGKSLLQSLNKYYLADIAFRRIKLGKQFGHESGHLLENAVYLELRRRNKRVYVGKMRDKEVDFITEDWNGYIHYYQVAWTTTNSETLTRELAPLEAIKDSYPKYLITMDNDFNPVYNGIRKIFAPDWFLDDIRF
jgi:predicted AAA+ superfamily ATPase